MRPAGHLLRRNDISLSATVPARRSGPPPKCWLAMRHGSLIGDMDESQLLLPTVDEYVRAFEAADRAGKITPKQREMLIFPHSQAARAVSARVLAESVGFTLRCG